MEASGVLVRHLCVQAGRDIAVLSCGTAVTTHSTFCIERQHLHTGPLKFLPEIEAAASRQDPLETQSPCPAVGG